jgi:transcriptional regulator with XRE-family HTH domain
MNKVTRVITPHDLEVAKRLNRLYLHKKSTEGLTQTDIAEKLGVSQSTIAQYLAGTIALRNAQTLCALAEALGVRPTDIDPKLKIRFPEPAKALDIVQNLPTFTLEGDTAKAISPFKKFGEEGAYVITLDDRYDFYFPKGTKLLLDPMSVLKKHQWLVVKIQHGFRLFKLHDITAEYLKVYFPEAERLRGIAAKRHMLEAEIDYLYPVEILSIPLNTMQTAHKLRGIEYPN